MQKKVIFLILSSLIFVGVWVGFMNRQVIRERYARWQRGPVPEAITRAEFTHEAARVNVPTAPAIKTAPAAPKPPSQLNLKIPFVPQAPFKIWDTMHEDTCEEASILMVRAFLNNETTLAAAEAERRLQDLVDYQIKKYGDFKSTDADRTAKIMVDYLHIQTANVVPLVTADDIRREITAGRPVIVPTSGKALHNPNFKNGGPLYHMLVIKGYTPGKFVTNDPGTRLGAEYVYDEDVLMNAAHDWNNGDVSHGAKVMIVLK